MSTEQTLLESYAFGVSAALRDLGMEKEAAVELAVKEAKAGAGKALLSRLGGHAAKAKEGVTGAAKAVGERTTGAAKAVGAAAEKGGKKSKDIAGKVYEKVTKSPGAAAGVAGGVGAGAGLLAGRAFGKKD